MASPIQIILNDSDYEETRDAGGGGPKKDFFADRDREFRDHKAALTAQLETVARTLEGQAQSQGDIGYIKVILRRDAWAKSHRPITALFKPARIRLVGGGDLGEMYFEARPPVLREIAREIADAEEQTRRKLDKARNKMVPNPSAARSESGAIERIELYGPRDRRSFSVEEAVNWLARPMTGSAYHVELFDIPPPHSQWDAYDGGHQRLYASFVEGLAGVGEGLTVQRLHMRDKGQPYIAARLAHSPLPPTLILDSPIPGRSRSADIAPFDRNVDRHRRLPSLIITPLSDTSIFRRSWSEPSTNPLRRQRPRAGRDPPSLPFRRAIPPGPILASGLSTEASAPNCPIGSLTAGTCLTPPTLISRTGPSSAAWW